MKKKWWWFAGFFCITLVSYQILFTNTILLPDPQTYKQAYLFNTLGHDGKAYQLTDYAGQWVVLEWFNNECPFVEKHYGTNNMQRLQSKYKDKGVLWFTVASSQVDKQGHLTQSTAAEIIKDRKSFPTAILLDHNGDMARGFQASATPHMVVINPKGYIFYEGAIDDQPSFNKNTIQKARNFVSEALDMGLSGKKQPKVRHHPAYGCTIKNDLKSTPTT